MQAELWDSVVFAMENDEYSKGRKRLCAYNRREERWEFCCLGIVADKRELYRGEDTLGIIGDQRAIRFIKNTAVDKAETPEDDPDFAKLYSYLPDGYEGLDEALQRRLGVVNDEAADWTPVIAYWKENVPRDE